MSKKKIKWDRDIDYIKCVRGDIRQTKIDVNRLCDLYPYDIDFSAEEKKQLFRLLNKFGNQLTAELENNWRSRAFSRRLQGE